MKQIRISSLLKPVFWMVLAAAVAPWSAAAQSVGYQHDASGNLTARFTSGSAAPFILGQPVNQIVLPGAKAGFSVIVSNTLGVNYQWQWNGTNLSGATNDTLSLTNVTIANEGNYAVIVSNSVSAVPSLSAKLFIDADGDGLPDSWELANFGTLTNQNAAGDFDHDGISNLDEFLESTSPTNSASGNPRLSLVALGGTVQVAPLQDKYTNGQTVLLTAFPDAGGTFMGWGKDLSGASNPAPLVLNTSKTVTAIFGLPLGQALDNGTVALITGGGAPWFGQTNVTHDGVDAAQSGPINKGELSWMEITVTNTQPAALDFWWQLLPGDTSDYGTLLVNGVEQPGRLITAAGWQFRSQTFAPGTNTVRWVFSKSSENTGYMDIYNGLLLDQLVVRDLGGLTINSASVAEGNVGTTNATLTVTLSPALTQAVTVAYATTNLSASSGSDFYPASGVLTFAPGQTNQTVIVSVVGDIQVETNETFAVVLSVPSSNAFVLVTNGIATIINDDGFPGQIQYLTWSPIGSPQLVNQAFPVTLTARDAAGNTASNFSGTASFSVISGTSDTAIGSGTNTSLFPMGTYYHDERTQIIYYTNEVGGAGQITSLALDVATIPGLVLNNWTIRLKHTTLTNFNVASWESSGWTTVYAATQTITNTNWVVFNFSAPFDYNGTNNLVVDLSFNNNTYSSYGYCRTTSNNQNRVIYYLTDSGYGDPLSWSGATPYPNTSVGQLLNVKFGKQSAVPVTVNPIVSGNFANGVWSGNLSLQGNSTNLLIRAYDGNGHSGASSGFDLYSADDLSLTLANVVGTVSAGSNLVYSINVVSPGPGVSTVVKVTNTLPANVSLVSATASQGTLANDGNQVICTLGNMGAMTIASINITVLPNLANTTLTFAASVTRNEADPNSTNNSATLFTLVNPPSITIADQSLTEGNTGTTNARLTVNLSALSATPVTVAYYTSDGTASQTSDYLATNGLITFVPGVSAQTITVPVYGDILVESNETFFVTLTNATNGLILQAQAVTTIISDDGIPGQVHHFAWNSFSNPQLINQPFPVTIQAQDAMGNPASSFAGSVQFGISSSGGADVVIGTGTGTKTYPLGAYYHDERTQVIYLSSELGASGRFTSISLDVATVPGQLLNNWTIRMKHTSASSYASSTWDASGWTIVYQANQSITATGWTTFNFSVPFDYNNASNLMVDFSFNNSGYTSYGYCRYTTTSQARTLYYLTDSGYGDPLLWNGTSPSATSVSEIPNVKFTRQSGPLISVTPASSGAFTAGSWTGNLTLPTLGTNFVMTATDAEGHLGISTPFNVNQPNQVPPTINQQPQDVMAPTGAEVTFSTLVNGTPALAYQWLFNGTNIIGATTSSLTVTSITTNQAGTYAVSISNAFGVAISSNAVLSIGDFKIVSLKTNHSAVVDHNAITGDDRGPIAASSTTLFYSGDVSAAKFSLVDLSGATALGRIYDGLVSDLKTETVYLLANGTNLSAAPGTVSNLVQLDSGSGLPTANLITLSTPITLASGSGFFAGFGRVVLHNGTRVYSIALPSGIVTDLGAMTMPAHSLTEQGSFWGVAEFFDNAVSLVYVQSSAAIARTRVPEGTTTILANFSSLSDMAGWTVSIPRNRWYFHHENGSQFGGTTETAGYADAQFQYYAGPIFQITRGSAGQSGNNFNFSFRGHVGQTYVIEYKNSLSEPWSQLQIIPGSDGDIPVTDPGINSTSRFYHIKIP